MGSMVCASTWTPRAISGSLSGCSSLTHQLINSCAHARTYKPRIPRPALPTDRPTDRRTDGLTSTSRNNRLASTATSNSPEKHQHQHQHQQH